MEAERVAVAMSGGVDSSVAAALLVEQGYEVIGFTMQIWPRRAGEEGPAGWRGCCGLDAIQDARRVARVLGIRHYVLDLREAFRQLVIERFCSEYEQGRTPNPCIWCNTDIKFGPFLERARAVNARHLATGHYARVDYDERRSRWRLRRAVDHAKDQSYVLYQLQQEQLALALFPLGELTKPQVRARARQLGLSVSEKPESQEICFVSERRYGEWLRRWRPELARAGPIVDGEGRQVGRHRGIAFYTIGQRRGLGIARGRPLYVTRIEAAQNRLVVGGEADLLAGGLLMREVNYSGLPRLPEDECRLQVKVRYTAGLATCWARPEQDAVRLRFARRQRAVTPGQAAVCYEGDTVAFGGVVEKAL